MKPIVEQLESRDTPSATLTNGVLDVVGGKGNEIITVTQSPAQPNAPQTIQVNLNGVKSTYQASQVSSIVIDGSAGQQDILTNLTALPATIIGSKHGNDDLQSFGSQTTIIAGSGNDLIYDVLGSGNVISLAPGGHHDVVADNVNSVVNGATNHDQVAVFFQTPIGSGKIYLDNSGNLFIYPTNNGSSTTVNQVGRNIIVTYQDGASGSTPVVYTFAADQVKTVCFFGGAGNDTFINNTKVDTIAYGFKGNDTIIGGFGKVNLLKGAASNSVVIGRGNGFNDVGGGEIDGTPGTGYDVLIDLGHNHDNVLRYGPLDEYFSNGHDILIPLF